MWEKIRAYLTFTRKERLGVLVLLVIIVLLFIVPYFFRPETGSVDIQAYEKYKEDIGKFPFAEPERSGERKELPGHHSDQLRPAGDSMQYAPRIGTPSGKTLSGTAPFYFDPNHTSTADWHRLGLPDKLILTIEHYIQKGGSFRAAADLKKIYGLRPADYERLFPYVRIREPPAGLYGQRVRNASAETKNREFPSAQFGEPSAKDDRMKSRAPLLRTSYRENRDFKGISDRRMDSGKKWEELDINQADSADWCKLPGIGVKLASRIIHFRDKLGGFYEVDQLRETFGLPDATFQLIRPYMRTGSTELQKLNLNEANQATLQMHPYIRWKLAKEIIRYREQHGGFKSVAELQQLVQMDSEKFKKLEPYLELR